MKLVRSVSESANPNLKYKGFLLTMVDTRTKLTKQIMDELQSSLKDLLFQTIVPRNVRLAEVPMRGKPAILFDASSPGSTSYLKLAEEILSRNSHPVT
jgi:chromosome partitioning protein